MALGELLAVGSVQQRQVRIQRQRPLGAETGRSGRLQHEHLLGRVRKVILATHHMRDAEHRGRRSRPRSCRAPSRPRARSPDRRGGRARSASRRGSRRARRSRLRRARAGVPPRRAQPRRGTRARRRGAACRPSRPPRSRWSGRRARPPAAPASASRWRSARSVCMIGPSSQSSSSQRSASRICSTFSGSRALAVGVLDAQHELPAGVTGEQPVEQRGARAADVQCPGRRGGEAHAHRFGSARPVWAEAETIRSPPC